MKISELKSPEQAREQLEGIVATKIDEAQKIGQEVCKFDARLPDFIIRKLEARGLHCRCVNMVTEVTVL